MELKGEDITFTYPCGKTILKNVNISVTAGQVLGLTAASGRGKTTLAKILAGYECPEVGKVMIDEMPLPKKGFIPVQLIYQHPEKAVNPILKIHHIINEGGGIDDRLFDTLEINKEWLHRYPTELSAGELQRLCILRAIKKHTRFLIADELTAMLDPITQLKIWKGLLKIIKERNIGVLVISHSKHLLDRMSDNIIELDQINEI